MARKRKPGEPGSERSLSDAIVRNGRIGLFVAELALRDGRISEAAKASGLTPAYGRKLLQRYSEIRERTRRFKEEGFEAGIQAWRAMHPRALGVIGELMENADPRIRLSAAKLVIERCEGRPPQGLDLVIQEQEQDQADSVRFRFAVAVAHSYGWSLERALQYADEHPQDVQEWWEGVGGDHGPSFDA